MKLLFWLWKSKADSSGLAPIYARVTVNGKSCEISTGIKIDPQKWESAGNGRVRGATDQVRLYNARLADIRSKIDQIYFSLEMKKKPITATLIKNIFQGEGKLHYTLLEVLDNTIIKIKDNPDIAKATLKTYRSRSKSLRDYLKYKKRNDLLCEEVDVYFAKDYFHYLKREKKHSQNHAAKTLLVLKKVIRHAVELNILDKDPLLYFFIKREKPKPIIALDDEQLQRLANYRFASLRLQQVTDLFVLQCCTGMAYAEVSRLQKKHIGKGIDGKNWIFIDRQKVMGAHCSIPLLPRATTILEKYDYKLPVISNGKYNAYLKEVAEILDIDKHLTTHVGRKTCGMLLLNHGVPIETVSRILGHSNIRITQQAYAKVLDEKIARDMDGIDF